MLAQHPSCWSNAALPRVLIIRCAVHWHGVLNLLLPDNVARIDGRLQRHLEYIDMDLSAAYMLWRFQNCHPDVDTVLRQRPAKGSAVVQPPIAREDIRPPGPRDPTIQELG